MPGGNTKGTFIKKRLYLGADPIGSRCRKQQLENRF
jgi:hypothetical protein